MRLIQFILNGIKQFGAELKDGKRIYNLSHIADNCIDYLKLIDEKKSLEDDVRRQVEQAENADENTILKSNIDKILAPITAPDKLICMGMNYKDHCEEQNAPIPVEPIVFNKFPSCIVGPSDSILYPKYDDITQEIDWEVELAFVIGKKGKYIPVLFPFFNF
jgi:2-keto-4-pentenoate hydratase/2-oxohepta-3-ene-1,7-dioic acid hydratase in catechol pathway